MKMYPVKNKNTFLMAVLIPIAVGIFSALLSQNMSQYSTLNKPPLSPPGFLFPIIWFLLYILMGISSYLIYEADSPYRQDALRIYALQLFFNFMWSILFFRFSFRFVAFLWLLVLIFLIVKMICQFYQVNPYAAYLQIPYLIWCVFAAYLNFMFFVLN